MELRHQPRVVTLGETMVLVTPTEVAPLQTAELFRLDAGGAESNLASHLATMGYPSAWISRLGEDPLGHRLAELLRGRGVDISWVVFDPDAPTGVYFKNPGAGVHYYRAGSAASRMGPAMLQDAPIDGAEIVHLSGITPALSPSCAALVDATIDRVRGLSHTADTAPLLSFDVNYRPALWPLETAAPALLALARRADLVLVGLDEAQTLWGIETAADVRALLPEPTRLVIKDGDVGATEFGPDGTVFVPAIPTEVVEAVGAGDAFAAGYLAAHLDGKNATVRLQRGHERAVLVLRSTTDFVADA